MLKKTTVKKLKGLSDEYKDVMSVMEGNAQKSIDDDGRAYGGFIRTVKGKLQEKITQSLVEIAWGSELNLDMNRLAINSNKIRIPIKPAYLSKIKSIKTQKEILAKINDYYYGLSVDKHVFIDGKFVIGIECKAYAENAMIKRILVDFMLLKTKFPELKTYLFQLESMLGGDYEQATKEPMGSKQTHSIMSYFDTVDLQVLTLIKGARKVNQPINKPEFFKPLEMSALEHGIEMLVDTLKGFK